MKYLEKRFSVAVSNPRPRSFLEKMYDTEYHKRRAKAKQPHEYENGGSMCQICGLDRKAKIHESS